MNHSVMDQDCVVAARIARKVDDKIITKILEEKVFNFSKLSCHSMNKEYHAIHFHPSARKIRGVSLNPAASVCHFINRAYSCTSYIIIMIMIGSYIALFLQCKSKHCD